MDTLADILRDIARQMDKGDPPMEFTETLLGLAHDVRVDHAVGQAIKYLPLSELIDVLERRLEDCETCPDIPRWHRAVQRCADTLATLLPSEAIIASPNPPHGDD
jgi:hypothetical protein